jgi:hypothetical protein
MTPLIKTNYIHQHVNYNHVIYSKEKNTPLQLYHTYTELGIDNLTLLHHHHIYRVEYIPPIPNSSEHVYTPLESSDVSKDVSSDVPSDVSKDVSSDVPSDVPSDVSSAAESLLTLRNSLDKQSFLYYYNDYDLRKRIKDANPNFSLIVLNDYMVKEWVKMSKVEREPWSTPAIQKMFRPRSSEIQIFSGSRHIPIKSTYSKKIEDVDMNESNSRINICITKDIKYSNNELLKKRVSLENKKGIVIGLCRRTGRQLRFRVDWGEKCELYYKKHIINMLDN